MATQGVWRKDRWTCCALGWASSGPQSNTCPQCHTVHVATTNRPPSCTVGPNGLSSNSSSPRPHAVHALMHAPSNIGWRCSAASQNSSSPQPHAVHALMHAPSNIAR
jgi:hypothetical protein